MRRFGASLAVLTSVLMAMSGVSVWAEETTAEETSSETNAELSGTITMSGSTSMEKLCNAFAEDFSDKNPDVTIAPEFTGSGAGIEAVSNGTVDIGNASRALKDSEKEKGLSENIVAYDGIAIVVDKDNAVDDLTLDQLKSIYLGETTNWSALGGEDSPIVVIGREAGSGTRGAFEELLDVADQCVYANELDNTGAVMAKVASTPGAIGYVSLDVVDDSVKAVKLEGVEPTAENILSGDYALYRPFVMATKGEITEQSDLVQAFFDYVYSEEGASIIEQVGLIVPDAETSVGIDYMTVSGTVSMSGSTSMEKLCNAIAEDISDKNPDLNVTPEFTGSGAGIEAVSNGTVDIGNASRALKDSEKEKGLVENIVAIDGIAVVTDPSNTVTDLTQDQLKSIYLGEVTNWSALGGEDSPIVVIGREAGSGTRGAFEELLDVADQCVYANELDNTGAVMAKVASTPGAIGYVSLDVVDDSVNAEKIDGVEPTAENILAGDYALSRPFVMATKGEISEQNDAVQGLFNYIYSEDGKAIIEKVGLIPVEY